MKILNLLRKLIYIKEIISKLMPQSIKNVYKYFSQLRTYFITKFYNLIT